METEKIFDLIKDVYTNRVMIDVGAFDGGTFKPFLLNNWKVYAFEPNPNMYKYIQLFIRNNPYYAHNLKLEKKCVNDIEQDNLKFYLSDVSKGISSLTPFHNSHKKASFTVSSVRLDNYIKTNNINHVYFLKIDTEGHDYFVIKSYPWDKDKPDVIECEFEDLKSVNKLNYNWKDMAEYLNKMNDDKYKLSHSIENFFNIKSKGFMNFINARSVEMGHSIGVKHGEGFTSDSKIKIDNLFNII